MKNEYFTLDGLAFQVQNSDVERMVSMEIAMEILNGYCRGTERADAADKALCYMESHVAKLKPFTGAIRATYHLDHFEDYDQKMAICTPALRAIKRRLAGQPV